MTDLTGTVFRRKTDGHLILVEDQVGDTVKITDLNVTGDSGWTKKPNLPKNLTLFERDATGPFGHPVDDYTILDFIRDLEAFGDAIISNVSLKVHSYRGDYAQAALEPYGDPIPARDLASALRSQLGTNMVGHKGGDFPVDPLRAVYIANEGCTGRAINGLRIAKGEVSVSLDDEERW